MRELTDDGIRDLSRALASVLDARAPGWTDRPSGDPGITLLEVMAFLSEAITYREATAVDGALAGFIRNRLIAWTALCETGAVRRVRYFAGQVLGVQDFQDEQNYHRGMRRRLVQCLVGAGVVRGLAVEVSDAGGGTAEVSVSPGCAVTSRGDLLVIDQCKKCVVILRGPSVYVSLLLLERDVRPVPVGGTQTSEATRIEELVAIVCAADAPLDGVAIARLTLSDGQWTVDPV